MRTIVAVDENLTTVVSVAICGDPVVGRALELLLMPTRYHARFLPLERSDEPGCLGDAGVVLLAPTPGLSSARRETLSEILREGAAAGGIPVLELTALTGWAQVGPTPGKVPWPCTTEELVRRIDGALFAWQESKLARAGDRGEPGGRSGGP